MTNKKSAKHTASSTKAKSKKRASKNTLARAMGLGSDWRVDQIAYNGDGNIVILNPRIAAFLRHMVVRDHKLVIGLPPPGAPRSMIPPKSQPAADDSTRPVPVVFPRPIPIPQNLLMCGGLTLRLTESYPADLKRANSKRVIVNPLTGEKAGGMRSNSAGGGH